MKHKNKYKKIKRDLEFIDYVKNWKNNQNISVNHFAPKNFIKGDKISLSCKLNKNENFLGYLNFREVNQSKNG